MLALLFVGALLAQPAEHALPALVLSAVLADVDANSPAVTAALARARASGLRADVAGAWSDPFIAVGPDEYALGMHPPMLRYQVSQAIPLPGKLAPRTDAARAQTRALHANIETTRRRLRVMALELFLRAVHVDRALAANVTLRHTLDDVVASAEARYVSGGASAHHDVLLALAEHATLERDSLALSRERAVLLGQLDELAGRVPGDPARRLDDDGADDDDVPASFAQAVVDQPEVASAGIAIEAAEARVRAADVAALPDLVVQGMAMQSFMPEEPSNIGAMIGVSVPIFYPWKQGPLVDAAAADKSAWETEHRQLELRLRAEWQEAQTRLKAAQDTLALYDDKIVPATAAALESSRAAYATQSAPLVELLSIVRAATTVELERAAAALDVRLARARLVNLLSMPSTTLLAPSSPTLFSPSMGGMGGGMRPGAMGRGMRDGMGPVRLGTGMTPPGLEVAGGDDDGGMSGMGGM